MTARKQNKTWKAWGGFTYDGIDMMRIDDGQGGWGHGLRDCPAIFKTRREARSRYCDVRRVTISLSKPKRQARKVK